MQVVRKKLQTRREDRDFAISEADRYEAELADLIAQAEETEMDIER